MKRIDFLKVILSSVLSLTVVMVGNAAPITMEKARSNAMEFLLSSSGKQHSKGTSFIKPDLKHAGSLGHSSSSVEPDMTVSPAIYAFNIDGGGFVLAAGDDAAEPILAYGEKGSFHPDSIPPNMKEWIKRYEMEIKWARSNGLTAANSPANSPLKARANVSALVKSTWAQGQPFNDQCIFNGTRCRVGCTATAMAQIMYYWASVGKDGSKFQHGCTALPAYTTTTQKYNVPKLGAVTNFDWSSMTNGKPTTTAGKAAVAKLMRYCGQSVEMDYTSSSSGGSIWYAAQALKDNFFYNSAVKVISEEAMTNSTWTTAIYNEISNGKPVLMSGYGKNGEGAGHAFICDGYKDGKFHFNWGWGGYLDGFFSMSALNTDYGTFSYEKEAVIGIQPFAKSRYVVQSDDYKTLTFYHDNKKYSRKKTYELDMFNHEIQKKTSVTKVVFDASFASYRPTTTDYWFEGFSALTTLSSITNLNTSSTTDMGCMFKGCKSLKSISLSSFNTSKVTSMYSMFDGCSSLTTLDLSTFDMSKVTSSNYMLRDCSALKSITIPATMTNASAYAFSGVGSATSPCTIIAPSGFKFGVDLSGVCFWWKSGCFFLKDHEVAYGLYIDTENKLAFHYDAKPWSRTGTKYSLNTGTTKPEWNSNAATITLVAFAETFSNVRPTSTYRWFDGMTNLTNIRNIKYLNTSNVTNMFYMFKNCQKLTSIDLSGFNTANVTDMSYMFDGCSSLTTLDLSKFDMSKVTSSNSMAYDCKELKKVIIPATMANASASTFSGVGSTTSPCTITAPSGFDFGTSIDELYFRYKTGYFFLEGNKVSYALLADSTLKFYHDALPWTRTGTKYSLPKTTTIGWSGAKSSYSKVVFDESFAEARPPITSRWFMFHSSLTKVEGMENLNMSEVTSNTEMFYGCSKLSSITLPGTITHLDKSIFQGCTKLEEIDIPAGVESIGDMAFNNCSSLVRVSVGFTDPLPITMQTFSNRKNAYLTVPGGYREAFAAADYWKEFKGINEDSAFAKGDVNHDGVISVSDVTLLVDYLIGNHPENFHAENGDINNDGIISIADVQTLVDNIMR
ncbi:MAG: C10 family peptidase [Prevotella sp.]|nr:C10 family peptidase [Prevotella sp.]